jgi:hypothetical protein
MSDRRIIASQMDNPCWVIWQAWDDRFGADDSPCGYGPTEAEAIADLEWQLDDMEAEA